jgi:uncharacterized protein (TIGR01244 family)
VIAQDPGDIRAWQRLGAELTTSGKLDANDPARLAALGVRHVINLALDDHPEALADEAALLAASDIAYTHIPVPFAAPAEEHFAAFCAALDAVEGAVHVHCIMNWRVSAFFYRYHLASGMAEAEARALMEQQWSPEKSDNSAAAVWARFIKLRLKKL